MNNNIYDIGLDLTNNIEDKLDIIIDQGEYYAVKVYSDSSYTYFCKALPGTSLSASSWQVKRMDVYGSTTFAGGVSTFTNPATDLSTVQGLF